MMETPGAIWSLRMMAVILRLTLTVATAAAVISGCSGKELDLPFETIERANTPGTGQNYEEKVPKLVIIAQAAEINLLGNAISTNAQAQLRNLDFNQHLAVTVFQGSKRSGGYGAEIWRVTRKGDAITIYARFTERDPRVEASGVLTSPYHVVKVQKTGLQGKIEFTLNVDGVVASRQTLYIP